MTSTDEQRLVRRWRRGAVREVLRRGDRLVKRFKVMPGSCPERPWQREHAALERLAAFGYPRSFGCRETTAPDGSLEAVFEREFVEGSPLESMSTTAAAECARGLAAIHDRGIVTDDASRSNFLVTADGRYRVIDFGRAMLFDRKGAGFWWQVAREHRKAFRELLGGDRSLFLAFREAYWAAAHATAAQRLLVDAGCGLALFLRRARKGCHRLLTSERRRWEQERYRPQRYARGSFVIGERQASAEALAEFIMQERFLATDAFESIYTRNLQHQVFTGFMAETGSQVMMKRSWLNPAYPWPRRLELRVSRWFVNRCRRAYLGALRLVEAGFSTGRPLACWTHKPVGRPEERYVLYERVESSFSLNDYVLWSREHPDEQNTEICRVLIEKMAILARRLHDSRLRHDDLAFGNLLVETTKPMQTFTTVDAEGCSLSLIDTERVWPARRAPKAVKRFLDLRNFRRLKLTRGERRKFLETYLGSAFTPLWWQVFEFIWRGNYRFFRRLKRRTHWRKSLGKNPGQRGPDGL